jgi:ADP-ribose pyrophosphatase YjhB (NUDIX family)
MRGYEKGTDVAAEIAAMRSAFVHAVAALRASPDAEQAFRDASALGDVVKQLEAESAAFRAYLAAKMADASGMTMGQLAKLLGMSRSRAAQLVAAGRSKEDPVTDPGTEPEPASVALAIIAADGKILVGRRHDRIPPWTFPAAEIKPGESPAVAAARAVQKETGLSATVDHVIGRRIHPKTGRLMIYMEATADGTDTSVSDADIAEVRWIDLAEADQLMPDMFPTVRPHLGRVLGS